MLAIAADVDRRAALDRMFDAVDARDAAAFQNVDDLFVVGVRVLADEAAGGDGLRSH